MARDNSIQKTERLIGVLHPKQKDAFLENNSRVLTTPLIPARSIGCEGSFRTQTHDVSVYFERFDVVSIAGPLSKDGYRYFKSVVPERVRRAQQLPYYFDRGSDEGTSQCTTSSAEDSSAEGGGTQETTAIASAGVKVAVLDSGFDRQHPAFVGRNFVTRSFVDTAADMDGEGHGTACASLICGKPDSAGLFGGGVAPGADLVIGKIFDESMSAEDTLIIAAIQWALDEGCSVISLSIGDPVQPGTAFSQEFEDMAIKAKDQGAIIVAGAGNDSHRSAGDFDAVNHPANCPSVMAVGAVDRSNGLADFSNRCLVKNGGEVDLVAVGMSVFAANAGSIKFPHIPFDGTSFAVPFVAGVAALWKLKFPAKVPTAQALWDKVLGGAQPLPQHLDIDVGKGLARTP